MIRSIRRENQTKGPADMIRLSFLTPVWQVLGQSSGLTVRAVSKGINRLMAHANSLTFKLQSIGELLWQPNIF